MSDEPQVSTMGIGRMSIEDLKASVPALSRMYDRMLRRYETAVSERDAARKALHACAAEVERLTADRDRVGRLLGAEVKRTMDAETEAKRLREVVDAARAVMAGVAIGRDWGGHEGISAMTEDWPRRLLALVASLARLDSEVVSEPSNNPHDTTPDPDLASPPAYGPIALACERAEEEQL